ncbi:pituitary tumor-transforming gene 1 protein-interacting protein precursor [Esox lucius]|uniref:Pituitary tumor-transforming gene 1 protein-interacting protein n=1 Tax=Esox lucius TaxID=8010 RepID=C1BZF0_ESOLU|nr:pituitary tumor-transforming gene 1 protein-interacting protein precursor [Esox lucius]ACO14403.1 Pituitary tumor-transforming gene 1 protein-interacting protein precursor [Esox lucius]
MSSMKMFVLVVGCVLVSLAGCQTTLPKPSILCKAFSTCDSCIKNTKCLWCMTNSTCTDYPASYILPPPAVCKLSQARWGVCWVNFEALIIAMAVVGGTILVSIIVCCCCCCCCCKRQQGPDRDEERFARRREEIRQRSDERKVERKAKHDDIRKKYGLTGLITDSDHPYRKFENE